MNFVWMTLAFLVLTGVALVLCNTLKVNMGEGTLLSATFIVLSLFLGAKSGSFQYGMYVICIVAVMGYLLSVVQIVKRNKFETASLTSPYFILFVLLFAYSMIVFYNDFIQHVDEFHQWAAAVKYMLEKDQMPVWGEFIGEAHPYMATSLFHLFFQKFSGYNEQNMYVSAFLLMWIGFLLPFSGYERKDWKKAALYTFIIYIAIYSLYYYSHKNLYVDLPVAGWSGGLAGWWMNRTKKKTNVLIGGSGLAMICFFKPSAGLLMAVLVVLFMLVQKYLVEERIYVNSKNSKYLLIAGSAAAILGVIVIAVVAWSIFNPEKASEIFSFVLGDKLAVVELSADKAKKTLAAFITALVGSPLNSRSSLRVVFLPFLFLLFVLLKVIGDIFQKRQDSLVYMWYMAGMSVGFCAVVYVSFLFLFVYEESVKVAGVGRYLSICALYLLVIVLTLLLKKEEAKMINVPSYIAMGLTIVFLSGMNTNFITLSTALNKEKIPGYEDILSTRIQIEQILEIITETDKVYLIKQDDSNEYVTNAALYYLENQVSNYLATPWKFTENGSIIRVQEGETPAITDFAQLLAQGGYTYVWIYASDNYLKNTLPEVMECDKIKTRGFYRVVNENGEISLERVKTLKKEIAAG